MKTTIFAGFLLLFWVVMTNSSCIFPQNNDCFKQYAFEINFSCSPQKDTFKVGDTLWIESLIAPMLINQLDNTMADVSDVEYKIYADIHRYNEEVTSPPEYDFDFINKEGTFSLENIGPYAALKLAYDSNLDDHRILKVGCIPQSPGLYGIAFYYLTEDYRSIDGVIDHSCIETFNFTYIMNDNEDDNNYHLLEGYPQINTSEGFKKDGGYAFWVVE